ncbi:MAG: hypothetical protein HOW73_30830 [Polyangiaceae bacterium]|nr:hypothetical protein [Polyangiaceae bacterium]
MKRSLDNGMLLAVAVVAASCNASTGGELIEFDAFAAGPEAASGGEAYVFESPRGYTVTLRRAVLHVGAVYLNKSVQTSVGADTSCYLAGQYVAEVPGGFDVDVLEPTLQPFPVQGFATTDRAKTAEIWLSGGDIDAETDPTVVASVEGEATKDGETFPFDATITISESRVIPSTDPSQPGVNPICKQRIVTPIAVDLKPTDGGSLVVRIDPAGWFSNVEFDELELVDDDPPLYRFRDDSLDQPSRNLFNGLRANSGVYDVRWDE